MQVHQHITISQENWKKLSTPNCPPELVKKMEQAAKIGFFYLEIPENCRKLVGSTLEFANQFHKNPNVRKTPRQDDFTAYIERSKAQCNSLYIHETKWSQLLPDDVAATAKAMNSICIEILKVLLLHLDIPEEEHEKATGGMISKKGHSQFIIHHYDPEKLVEGLVEHKDFGLITLLFINKQGLQFKIGDSWVDAAPMDGHFVVNIGRTFEILINDKNNLLAPIHRVIQCAQERVSFLAQIDNNLNSELFQKIDGKLVVFHPNCRQYVNEVIQSRSFL